MTGEFHAQMASDAEMFPIDDVIMPYVQGDVAVMFSNSFDELMFWALPVELFSCDWG